jgi:CBS domain containing-hemolysin-like protein
MDPPQVGFFEILLKVMAVCSLVLLNGFFVAAEFALVKVRSTQIVPLARTNNRRAKIAENMIKNLDSYLSATQLGVTLTSLGLGWLGEPFVAELIRPLFIHVGFTSLTLIHGISFVLAFSIVTFLHIVVGELAPKSIAIQRSKVTTLWIAMPLTLFYKCFRPAIWVLNEVANRGIQAIGFDIARETEKGHSEEELKLLFSESNLEIPRDSLSRRVLLKAFSLKNLQARNIMLPRNRIDALFLEYSLEANLEIAKTHQHTRFPLCRETLDQVIGMVHMKDLLWQIQTQKTPVSIKSIAREILFFPESATLETILKTFLERRCHIAIIVDEFGGSLGLLTLEDILEELVGEIQDEFDEEVPLVKKISEKKYLIDGSTPLHDLEELVGSRFVGEYDATTLGGYLIEKLRDMPKQGVEFTHDNLKFSILRVEKRRISQVLMYINQPNP